MIKFYNLNDLSIDEILTSNADNDNSVDAIVSEIIKDVRKNKDAALFKYAELFDKVKLSTLEVAQEEIDEAFMQTDEYFIETLKQARDNIAAFHEKQLHSGFEYETPDGAIMGQKYNAVEKAGLYVPGGTASYPSTVLMTAVPAAIAGVSQIIMVTPPDKNGKIASSILAAAKIAGVTRIFKAGGAGAIAALAYGTQSIPKVDTIVGPGNIYVATAKRMVYGAVNIDMIAGPSDILVIADESANARYVAADMLGQAEHDTLATAILITTSATLAEKVQEELSRQIKLLTRQDIAEQSLKAFGKIILANDIKQAVAAANAVAPEHLELCVENPFDILHQITNAGSIFLGSSTPEALGDYFAGPNHTLPTDATAKFSSPLSTDAFIKKSTYLYYPINALEKVKDRVADFARREGLDAHAKSIEVRFE